MGKIIKYEIIKKRLDNGGLIERGDEISSKIVELIRGYSKVKANLLFTKYPNGVNSYDNTIRYKVHLKCDECSSDMGIHEVSKSRLLNKVEICSDCKNKIIENDRVGKLLSEFLTEVKVKENVDEYLKFLDPTHKWPKGYSHKERWGLINNDYHIDKALINEALSKLSYKEFLKTPYWKAVAQMVRYKANFRCQLCSNNVGGLNVHHKTYEHHGSEHNYLDDLICLCHECHQRFHEKLEN